MLHDLRLFLKEIVTAKAHVMQAREDRIFPTSATLYCACCGGQRRVLVTVFFIESHSMYQVLDEDDLLARDPRIYAHMKCLQCDATFTAVVYDGPSGIDLAVLAGGLDGLATPNTPLPVAYYLDQAQRAESAGARSAAVAMLRAAVEQFLFDQGFTQGMLNKKIEALVATLGTPKAPKWTRDLDDSFLDALKGLGNGAIHPNDGDITKQTVFDKEILEDIKVTMAELLARAYEQPLKTRERLAKLAAAAQAVKK